MRRRLVGDPEFFTEAFSANEAFDWREPVALSVRTISSPALCDPRDGNNQPGRR